MNTTESNTNTLNEQSAGEGKDAFIEIDDFNFFYGASQALHDLSFNIPDRKVTAFIGPSGCGKSTLLRSINRMNDLIDGTRHKGDIRINGLSVFDPLTEVISLRKRIGMVFQKSNPFPKSIYENVIYGLRVSGRNKKSELDQVVVESLMVALPIVVRLVRG